MGEPEHKSEENRLKGKVLLHCGGAHGGFFSLPRTMSLLWDVLLSGAGEQTAATSSVQGRLSRTGQPESARSCELQPWRVLGGDCC